MQGLEFYGQMSFIKGGLAYADKITTVSQNYAEEILQPELAYGLHGLLQYRSNDLIGILNGIDSKVWNPGTDVHIEQKYNRHKLQKKNINKTTLQKKLSLPINDSVFMMGMISRLVEQKGLEIILKGLGDILKQPVQLIILGTGETHYETQLLEYAHKYKDKLKIIIGYNEALAHQIEAACDAYLMPSTFEPCGLNQLYSLRYGSLPIVTNVGGLADTVIHANEKNMSQQKANGFVLNNHSATALTSTIKQAQGLYKNKALWKQLQNTTMQADFSWQSSAERYIKVYQQAVKKLSPPMGTKHSL